MASTRLKSDKCAYKEKLVTSTAPLNYALCPDKFVNKSKCRFEFGLVGGNNVSLYNGNLVDLESELRGQFRVASLCSSMKLTPTCNKKTNTMGLLFNPNSLVHQPSCQMFRYPPVPNYSPPNKYTC